MRVNKRRRNTIAKNRIIALMTAIMLVVSISSLTILAVAEGADYSPVVDTVDVYIPSDSGLNTESATDSSQDYEPEVNEPDSSVPDVSADGDINAESPSDSAYNQDDSSDADYTNNASEPEDGYGYNELENVCECTCDYYCDYECTCECDYCDCGYVEIEALAEFMVTDWDGLLDVFANLMTTDGPYTVSVVGDITMEAQLNIPAGRTVNLAGGGALYQPTANARHFGVDGTLVLNEIRLSGTGTANHRGGIMINGGELIMNDRSVVEGNTAFMGGGIGIADGAFTMYGGRISNNTAVQGGGVNLQPDSNFSMYGGEISNNNANFGGGIRVDAGELTMYGGSVSDNTADLRGGAIYVNSCASFVRGRGTFVMNDGIISGNNTTRALASGGGVCIDDSYFVMNGGTISENEAHMGGGINLHYSIFTMNGGAIINNIANFGGGISARLDTITMNGGTVSYNVAHRTGGGVFEVGLGGTFTMSDGTISGNTAGEYGGGISIGQIAGAMSFTMTGGAITNNTAGRDGGGISVPPTDFGWIYPNPINPNNYRSLRHFEEGTFSGNTAGNGRYATPLNYYIFPFGHLLNNYDINFRGSHRVELVAFILGGGNVSGDTDDIEMLVEYNTFIDILNVPVPERYGYNFVGWLLGNEVLTSADLAEMIVDVSMTFVAQWEAIEQTVPDYEYRKIRIYYYLEGAGLLINDTVNNVVGREYVHRVNTIFSLAYVVDRDELDSENDYVFEGWRVYVGGIHNPTYLADKNLTAIHGYFMVPNVVSAVSLEENIMALNYVIVGETISLVAVWSVVYDQGNGDEDSNGGTGDEVSNNDNGNQEKLPQTGIESNVLLWSALLLLALLMGIGTVVRVLEIKQNHSSGK